jgi:hypothetical protein
VQGFSARLRLGSAPGLHAPSTRGHQKVRVIDLELVGKDMRVRIRRHCKVALPDVLADPRPRDARRMQKRASPVAEVVRRERRHAGSAAEARM